MENISITRLLLSLITIFAIMHQTSVAQRNFICGTDEVVRQTWTTQQLAHKQQMDDAYMQWKNSGASLLANTVDTIYLVVHVIHLGEPVGTGTNISDTIIKRAIKGMSDIFRGRGFPYTPDIGLEFVLACQDPNGNPTTGIVRVDGSSIPNYATDGVECNGTVTVNQIQSISPPWDESKYVNIYVANQLKCGNAAGFAYFPNGVIGSYDMIFMDDNYFTIDVLTHEMGHFLDLYHTHEGGTNGCPSSNGCGLYVGDCCNDTPPHYIWECEDAVNSCWSSGVFDSSRLNIMSYCFFDHFFTLDQRTRMLYALQNIADRAPLLNYNPSCTPAPTPTVNGVNLKAYGYVIFDSVSSSGIVNGRLAVYNEGTSASGPFSMKVYIYNASGTCFVIDTIRDNTGLSPHSMRIYSFSVTTCGDTCYNTDSVGYIFVDIDILHEVSETDENDNWVPMKYTDSIPPFACQPTNPIDPMCYTLDSSASGYIVYRIYNYGDSTITTPFKVMLLGSTDQTPDPSDCKLDSAIHTNMGAHSMLKDSFLVNVCSMCPSAQYILLVIDYDNVLNEGAYGETNNICYLQLNGCNSSTCSNFTASFNVTGGCDSATITANPSGGTAPYTYTWIGLNPTTYYDTTQTISVPLPETLRVYIYDANNCLFDTTIIVTGGSSPTASVDSVINVSCNGSADGAVFISVSGGTPPYTHTWTPTPPNVTNITPDGSVVAATQLSAGTWTDNIVDAAGCSTQISVTIYQSPSLQTTGTIISPSCYGQNTGAVYLQVQGGTGPYTFSWSDGSTMQHLIGVPAGTYTVMITDANGCSKLDTFVITQPAPLATVISPNAQGDSLIATTTGGVPPYQYAWSTGALTSAIPMPPPGTYFVVTQDANMCSGVDTYVVADTTTTLTLLPQCEIYNNRLLTCNPGHKLSVSLYSISGLLIWHQQFVRNEIMLPNMVDNSGIYILKIENLQTQQIKYMMVMWQSELSAFRILKQ